ncbi:MAG: hypothetical protein ABI983_02280 [Acidobacteriota bacterium]
MINRPLLALLCLGLLATGLPAKLSAQSDLDAFMEKVLARRDDNWKKLQQYVLEEKEAFDLTGPGRFPLWGMRREYSWFIRDGIFVRSPVTADGVKLSEADRKKAEEQWIHRQQSREANEKRRVERRAKGETVDDNKTTSVSISPTGVQVSSSDDQAPPNQPTITNTDDLLKQMREPQFVSSAYFLKFRFEKGHYALAGRDKIGDIQALKIEYYPETGLFKEGRTKPDKKVKNEDDRVEAQMNKVSMVTLWIDPRTYQILQYTFDDIDMDFLPGRALVRIDDLKATMQMAQQFPNIWLPKDIEMHFGMMLAVGAVDATYRVDYLNYKEAAVTYKIK